MRERVELSPHPTRNSCPELTLTSLMAKRPQCKVDQFRETLSPERDAELIRFINRPNTNGTEIYNWLIGEGYSGSLQSIYTFLDQQKELGKRASKLNQQLREFQGVTPESVLDKVLVILNDELDNLVNGSSEEKDLPKAIAGLAKEIRGCVSTMNALKYTGDRKQLELAGAWRACQILKATFEDTSFSQSLDEAIRGAMIQIEEEG